LETVGGPPSIGHAHGFTSARWHSRQSHLIACSEAVKTDLIDKGIRPERITVMHYPVDPADMQFRRSPAEIRSEFGADSSTPVVGAFAHLSVKKGYRELIRAAEIVLRKLPTAQFWCFGEGPLRAELEQFARDHGLDGRFRLIGFRRDVPDLMRAIDVMCLPSHREPFGLVYVEAALAQRPVIACRAGGAPEIITHGETGLLVPPPGLHHKDHALAAVGRNIEPLADAVLTLLTDRTLAARYGKCARELALDCFTWPNYLTRLNQLYAKVADLSGQAVHPGGISAVSQGSSEATPLGKEIRDSLTTPVGVAALL
jgi:glycosyltransferase involved in cell wall biosynthesis